MTRHDNIPHSNNEMSVHLCARSRVNKISMERQAILLYGWRAWPKTAEHQPVLSCMQLRATSFIRGPIKGEQQ